MDRSFGRRALVVLLAAASVTGFGTVSARAGEGGIAERAVTFTVTNTNPSATHCASDGKTYTVRGSLVGPAAALHDTAHDAVTLYIHGSGDGSSWHFPAVVPGIDHITEMARLGHVSVFVHNLGYGISDPADGNGICFGSIADMTHQIVQQLRAGTYTTDGAPPTHFERVALAGHSGGGVAVEIYSVTYHDIDALVIAGWADNVPTFEPFYEGIGGFLAACATGGEAKQPGGPGGWAKVFSRSDWLHQLAYNVDPRVQDAFAAAYEADPCGIRGDTGEGLAASESKAATVTVPVLLVYGDHDGWQGNVAAYEGQRARYTGSSDVNLAVLPNTGHMMMLGRTAPAFRSLLSGWLGTRGL